MGLFDLFKKKKATNTGSSQVINESSIAKFEFLSKYAAYLVLHINNQNENNYSPIAAYENAKNELVGHLYVSDETSYSLSADEVIAKMRLDFDNRLSSDKIKSYVIFYHSKIYSEGIDPETIGLNCIFIEYKKQDGENGVFKMPYIWDGAAFIYHNISELTHEQTTEIVSTELEGESISAYFQEQVVFKPEM
ncbi:MAG: hypothetical protein DA408_18345 [Bacteroidetes bacterium]|nr:MAG: hypothetical protein C7N36_11725 [Bacteroidota bacterium]PTM09442.1 MAG: hypothetical protein DA408_18345 [Bacteroidota bacterium]